MIDGTVDLSQVRMFFKGTVMILQSVVYWVYTAINCGTQENETKMAEQPVFNRIQDLMSYQIWRGQRGTQGTQSNNFLPSKL